MIDPDFQAGRPRSCQVLSSGSVRCEKPRIASSTITVPTDKQVEKTLPALCLVINFVQTPIGRRTHIGKAALS
jgi:hypothetical protein